MDGVTKIGIFASSLLVTATAVWVYSPVIGTHADSSVLTSVDVGVSPVIALSLDTNELILDVTPSNFVSGKINATASSNSQYGYTISLEDVDNSSNMTHVNPNVSDVISSNFSGKKFSSSLTGNTWGFSLDGTNFYKVPVNGSPVAVKRTTEPMATATETTEVTFGVHVDAITAGAYSDEVLFTMYVNGQDGNPEDGTSVGDTDNEGKPEDDYDGNGHCATTKTIYDISTMQRMTPCICANTPTPNDFVGAIDMDGSYLNDPNYVPRTLLRDVRDNSTYLVSKLADGNCWMSQNLALNLSPSNRLTDETTDLVTKSGWTPEHGTQIGDNVDYAWEKTGGVARSFKPSVEETYFNNGTTQSSTPTGSGHEYDWEKMGILYNWYAATAGSGTSSLNNSAQAGDSICPKGWTLPTVSSVQGISIQFGLGSHYSLSRAVQPPLNIPLVGSYYADSTYLKWINAGGYAFLWTDKAGAYYEDAYTAIKVTGDGKAGNGPKTWKGHGMSVRCVARNS